MTLPRARLGGGTSSPAGAAWLVVRAIALRPWLWPVSVAEVLRLAEGGWWRRWPPLPMPAAELWRFRLETAYGGEGDVPPDARDVRSFLAWCRAASEWR
ncbi:MAG TPA: hypothetical protein VMR97_08315 [Acidimicrobiales bacterium]|nr:hypothetical protein [Acidimicrobiales bacterium]